MSEVIAAYDHRAVRRQFLSTVSALALLTSACIATEAEAADNDAEEPAIWIELGGQLQHVDGQGDAFAPAFVAANLTQSVMRQPTPLQAQNPPPFSFNDAGKISFQPDGSDWVFSATVNYGRSRNFKHVDHQTNRTLQKYNGYGSKGNMTSVEKFADTQVHRSESHAVLDFSVGKDVGLGMFGRNSSSVLSLGVRFVQFASNETFDIRARPEAHFKYISPGLAREVLAYHHDYHATGNASRGFHGIGPSLSWNSSAPLAGDIQHGEMALDWGANAALLFGRQKARAQHQESEHYYDGKCGRLIACTHSGLSTRYFTVYQHPLAGHNGVRTVTVPNIGGFAGASWRIENFKVSLGYRGDFFFGAVDGGVDTRKSENVGFYGPFASVSIGMGG